MKKQVSMTEQRVREILESWGANPSRWPADERDAASRLISQSEELQAHQAVTKRLDDAMFVDKQMLPHEADQATLDRLSNGILARLPQPATSETTQPGPVLAWLTGLFRTPVAVAASMLAVVSIVVVIAMNTGPVRTAPQDTDPVFNRWAWSEVTGSNPASNIDNDNQSAAAAYETIAHIEPELMASDDF